MKLLNSVVIPSFTGVLMMNSGAGSASTGAAGTVLRGAGAGVMPTWGAVSLTGDVSGDLPFSNIAQIATNRLVGRQASGTGDIEAITLGSNNGVAFDWATPGTLKISTSQDLQTSATPTFARLTMSQATGTSPLSVSSTTVCSNLNADLLDGYHASAFEFTQTSGVPRSNLGSPLAAEMALFEPEFNNKTDRHAIANIWIETSTDNTNWTDFAPTDAQKRLLVGGDAGTSIVIPYNTPYFRVRFRASSYVYLNALYAYFSTSGHTTAVEVWKKHDSGSWTRHTSSATQVSSWPGHLYLPHSTIPWHPSGTLGVHYHEVYALFTPTWNGTYPANGITLYRMQWWGGYPAAKRALYAADEYGSATFPLNIYSAAGSASAPSHATSGDIDTGIYSYGANQLGISAGGANVGIFDASGLTLASGDALRMPDNGAIYDTGGSINRFAFSTGSTYNCRTGGTHVFAVNGSTVLTVGSTGQIISPLAIGTAPLSITSTTLCTNLNADMVDGLHPHITGNNGGTWPHIAAVKSDGVMCVGRYLDFHHTSNDGVDYAARLYTDGTTNNRLLFDGKLRLLNGLEIGTQHDLTTRFESGFYSTDTASTAEGWPLNASWMHVISATHADTGTNYSLQISSDYFAQRFFVRSTNNSGATAWSRVIISASDVTQYGIAYGANSYGTIATTGAGTNDQLLLGVSSAAPAFATMSGDATITNAGVLTIASNAVTLAKMATMATNRLMGRQAAGTGNPEVLALTSDATITFDWTTAGTLKLNVNPSADLAVGSIFAGGATSTDAIFVSDVIASGGYSGPAFWINALGQHVWDDGFENAHNVTLYADLASAPELVLSDSVGHVYLSVPHLKLRPLALQNYDGELTNDMGQNALYANINGLGSNLVRTVFTQHGIQSVTNTTTETTLIHATSKIGTLTLPANHLKVGKQIRVRGKGYIGVTGSVTFTLKLKTTSGTLGTFTGTLTGFSNEVFDIDILTTVSSVGASGSLRTLGSVTITSGSFAASKHLPIATIPTNLTVDTTAAQILDITATWGTANVNNTLSLASLSVELIS